MGSLFDVKVSVYDGVTDRIGTVTYLRNFLYSVRHRDDVIALRSEKDPERRKALKLSLPAVTVSGLFYPKRKTECIKSHSGFICVDIDGKDNPGVSIRKMREVLCSRNDVAYASLSVGGNGMFAVIPLSMPRNHGQQFDALKKEFSEMYGITLDPSCRDVTRLRVVSYDCAPYVNEQASRYDGIDTGVRPLVAPSMSGSEGDLIKVQRCVNLIEEHGIDITGSYEDWFNVGASLASLGERGRYFFHVVSRNYPGYKYAESERKFTELLKSTRSIGLGTFFYLCSQYGITYKKLNDK